MITHISKAYRGDKHIGWEKTIARHEWFLGYGTSPGDEANAKRLAAGLEARWQLLKLSGSTELSQTDFEEIRDLVCGRAAQAQTSPVNPAMLAAVLPVVTAVAMSAQAPAASAVTPETQGVPKWLYESIDEFVETLKRQVKPDDSNADHMFNSSARIVRAKSGIADVSLRDLRRKELDDWLAFFHARPPSLSTGRPIGPLTIRNITQAIRMFLNQCVEWEWWSPPPNWERAFKLFSVKRLTTDEEKREQRKRPETHNMTEKRVLWHLALPFQRAMMALADWAGHTQQEIATLHFDDFLEINGEMYIDRHRHKTGVQGRWWIPPEPASAILKVMSQTPKDTLINPRGLAFLGPNNMPLVHRSKRGRRAKSDFVAQEWSTLLRWANGWGVRPISFKFMRKGTSQSIRDRTYLELSKIFCAQTLDDVQDTHYSRPSFAQLEKCIREIYTDMKGMFDPVRIEDHEQIVQELLRSQDLPPKARQSAA